MCKVKDGAFVVLDASQATAGLAGGGVLEVHS